jgi:hypothetical protein
MSAVLRDWASWVAFSIKTGSFAGLDGGERKQAEDL